MKYYITYFANVKFLKPNQIPISTAVWPPKFWKFGVDQNNVFLGISEELLSPKFLPEDAHICQQDCPQRPNLPHCRFLTAYDEYLATLDFNALQREFERTAEEVRKVTHYEGDPEIVLLVYEMPNNPCSERAGLKKLFADHGIILEEFTKKQKELLYNIV